MPSINWISHRGLHTDHIENTRNAFKAAVAAGFSSLETDLRTTVDGHVVLHHDSSMEKTAKDEQCIEEITLDQFKKTKLLDGQIGMSLEEFLADFAGYNWIFDIKPESSKRTIDKLKKWCEEKHAEHWLMAQARFLVWSREDDKYLRTCFPNATTLARESECRRAGFSVLLGATFLSGIKPNRVYALPPTFLGIKLFSRRVVEGYRSRGAKVLAYLPEKSTDVNMAVKVGVDEILTNGLPASR